MSDAPQLLAPIPEDSDADAAQADVTRSMSAISTADTPLAGNAPSNAWPACKEWPANREVRGEMTLKSSVSHRRTMRAVCSVRNGVLKIRSAGNTAVEVEVPVGELAVGLRRESVEMFTVATLPKHKNRMYDDHDEIYCFVDNQVKRNKWIAVFRRMGVPIFDLSYGPAKRCGFESSM